MLREQTSLVHFIRWGDGGEVKNTDHADICRGYVRNPP